MLNRPMAAARLGAAVVGASFVLLFGADGAAQTETTPPALRSSTAGSRW